MKSELLVSLAVIAGIFVFGLHVATNYVSKKFFERLIALHPEFADSFPSPSFGTRYGPILPSKMTYLKMGRYKELPEPGLRQLGSLAYKLLVAYVAAFCVTLVLLVYWKTQQQVT